MTGDWLTSAEIYMRDKVNGLRNERLNSHKPMTFIKCFHQPAQNVCEFLGMQSHSYNRLQSRLFEFCLPVQSYGDKTQQQITTVSALNAKPVIRVTYPNMMTWSSFKHTHVVPYILVWSTKTAIWQNVQAAHFHTMKVCNHTGLKQHEIYFLKNTQRKTSHNLNY